MTFTVTDHEFRTILRALDEARVDARMEALKGEKAGNEDMAEHFYAVAENHERLILELQSQWSA